MSIFPLDQFEKDIRLADEEQALYEKLSVPKTVVVRFGVMRLIGEFPYSGNVTPGCGSKLVVRTYRGLEIGEMLTSTCPNSGCGKSVSRQEMLEYIENSGGRDYPFFTDGRALRVATLEDMTRQQQIESSRPELVKAARARIAELRLPMKIIEADPILGGERLTFYFTAEERVDFRELAAKLAEDHRARIDLRQVGARDEARLIADYERCGQHCCCKQFLKVLKPISMRSAKTQKATLDPLKISGRCGRLMCCLRYEDETYETLRKRLPKFKKRVGTPEGPGVVVDTQILTQLVLVSLDSDGRRIAVPVEELSDPDAPMPTKPARPDPLRGMDASAVAAARPDAETAADSPASKKKRRRRGRKKPADAGAGDAGVAPDRGAASPSAPGQPTDDRSDPPTDSAADRAGAKKKRRRRRGGRRRKPGDGPASPPDPPPAE